MKTGFCLYRVSPGENGCAFFEKMRGGFGQNVKRPRFRPGALPLLRKERGRRLSGFAPDMVIIAGFRREMLDDLRTLCKGIVNTPAAAPWGNENPPAHTGGLPFLRKERGRRLSGFVPDMIIIAGFRREMLDDLRTFCEEIMNARRQVPRPLFSTAGNVFFRAVPGRLCIQRRPR